MATHLHTQERSGTSFGENANVSSRLLLHVCCAPCSTHAINELAKEYAVTLYFSNSNIFPTDEHERRLADARRIAEIYCLPLVIDPYDHQSWLSAITHDCSGKARKDILFGPEGGTRCERCFSYNLSRCAKHANQHGFSLFTTTLTISPYKDSHTILSIGRKLGNFLDTDFKKKDGFRKSVALSQTHSLYRQGYCGCEFSIRK